MKVKGQILICTAIMLNDHSNPYIESTTVLSDIYIIGASVSEAPLVDSTDTLSRYIYIYI